MIVLLLLLLQNVDTMFVLMTKMIVLFGWHAIADNRYVAMITVVGAFAFVIALRCIQILCIFLRRMTFRKDVLFKKAFDKLAF